MEIFGSYLDVESDFFFQRSFSIANVRIGIVSTMFGEIVFFISCFSITTLARKKRCHGGQWLLAKKFFLSFSLAHFLHTVPFYRVMMAGI